MSDSQGWDAIDNVLLRQYGRKADFHLGTRHPWRLGGPDPLDGISIYQRDSPVSHCHYVGYGMSELYDKESPDPEVSGWGFEFTIRAAGGVAGPPPSWPARLLQQLGKYVFDSGKLFEPGHTMKVSAGIDPDRPESRIRGITFVEDPELGAVRTPHGRLRFLQVVGLTTEEFEAARGGRAQELLDRIAGDLPLFVTDTARRSLVG